MSLLFYLPQELDTQIRSLLVEVLPLLCNFRWNLGTHILEFLEKIVKVVDLLTELDVITVHGFFVKRVALEPIPDLLCKRAVGEQDGTGNLIQSRRTGTLVNDPGKTSLCSCS